MSEGPVSVRDRGDACAMSWFVHQVENPSHRLAHVGPARVEKDPGALPFEKVGLVANTGRRHDGQAAGPILPMFDRGQKSL